LELTGAVSLLRKVRKEIKIKRKLVNSQTMTTALVSFQTPEKMKFISE